MNCSVLILLQNHPERHMKNIINLSNTAIETTKNRCLVLSSENRTHIFPGVNNFRINIILQNHPQRHYENIHNLSNTAIETTKKLCLERESNSHLWVSRPQI